MNKKYAINYLRCSGFSEDQIREIAEALKEWPKAGHWIPSHVQGSILDECSECGFSCGAFTFKFCPMCGAKMQEGGKE